MSVDSSPPDDLEVIFIFCPLFDPYTYGSTVEPI